MAGPVIIIMISCECSALLTAGLWLVSCCCCLLLSSSDSIGLSVLQVGALASLPMPPPSPSRQALVLEGHKAGGQWEERGGNYAASLAPHATLCPCLACRRV